MDRPVKPGRSEEEIRAIWNLYGESARVARDDGDQEEIGTRLREISTGWRPPVESGPAT